MLLNRFKEAGNDKQCEPEFVKTVIGFVLSGLDYLHNECRIVHRGASPILPFQARAKSVKRPKPV
jgi:hypothetical protein